MAAVWLEADVAGLVRLASLVDRVAKDDAPLTVRFTDLHRWITELPGFGTTQCGVLIGM